MGGEAHGGNSTMVLLLPARGQLWGPRLTIDNSGGVGERLAEARG